MSNIDLRCLGSHLDVVLHCIRSDSGEWQWSGPGWAGILRGTQQTVITALADAIGRGEIYEIDVHPGNLQLRIDRLGNTWHDGVYWPAHEYLQEITSDPGPPS